MLEIIWRGILNYAGPAPVLALAATAMCYRIASLWGESFTEYCCGRSEKS